MRRMRIVATLPRYIEEGLIMKKLFEITVILIISFSILIIAFLPILGFFLSLETLSLLFFACIASVMITMPFFMIVYL